MIKPIKMYFDSSLQPKIFIAGHQGMVGSAIFRKLKKEGYSNIITKSRSELDLTNQVDVANFFEKERPDQVYLAAAKVGGICANNKFPAEFIYENLMIEVNVIHHAFIFGVKKLLFLGSSCIYPKFTEQPIKESALLTDILEPTNEPYAIAKIAGIKLCESYNRQYEISHDIDYRSIMPTNLYGPGDSYDLKNSHVIPSLIKKFHEAKIKRSSEVEVWGSGMARREFLYVEDMALASILLMNIEKEIYKKYTKPMQSHINVGFGKDITISELADLVKKVVGYSGRIIFDKNMPEGSPQKLLDSSKLTSIGWYPSTDLETGLHYTYSDFIKTFLP